MPEKFKHIYERAAKRKGGEAALKTLLKKPKSEKALAKLGDDRYLSEFSKKIFQSGFVWRVVEAKWPEFEKAFFNFDVQTLLMQPPEFFEEKARDPAVIRNFKKIQSIQENALMIHDIRYEGQNFAQLIAEWPSEDITGLWALLKKRGSRLGGNTGPYALRTLGKDTFLLSFDVEKYLRDEGVFHGGATSKRSLQQIQNYFNELQQQSGLPLTQLSQIVSYSYGDNFVFAE